MFSLPFLEISKFSRTILSRLAIVTVLLVPAIYAGLYLASNWAPTDNLDRVKAVVVNLDKGADQPGDEGGRLEAGQELVDTLTDDGAGGFAWETGDASTAAEGLADGEYYAVLTVPANFSERLVSTAGDRPERADLRLQTDDANNFVIGQVANSILTSVKDNLDGSVTAQYLDQVYLGFNDLHSSIQEAADGAGDLSEGAGELNKGSGELDDGTGELAAGLDELASGASDAETGSGTLAEGAAGLADGADTAAGSSEELATGAGQVADGTSEMADAADTATARVKDLRDSVSGLTDEARPAISQARDDLDAGSGDLAAAQEAELAALQEKYPDDPDVQALVDRLDSVSSGLADAGDRADDALGRVPEADEVTQAADTAVTRAEEIDTQVNDLSDGAQQVASGNRELADGLDTLSSGADELDSGAGELHDGLVTLASGAADAQAAGAQVHDGASQLHDGSGELADGSSELATKLADGVEEIPTYDKDDRQVRSETVAMPVEASMDRENAVEHYGEGMAPFFVALALWIGGMITYMVLAAVPFRALASTAGSRRIAWAGYLPGAALGIGQVLVVYAAIGLILGFDTANWPLTLAFSALIAAAFAAIHQFFVLWLGGIGRLAALVLLMVQLATAGGTYPVETAPAPFAAIAKVMPMYHAVAGLRALIAGGDPGAVIGGAVFLLGTLAVFLTLSVLVCRAKRVTTLKQLHPTLQLQ